MDSLIFDVDGTLWDAVHNLSLCWNETAALYNYPLHSTYEDIKALMGRTTEQIAAALFPDFSKEKGLEVYMVGCSRQLAYLREGRPKVPILYEKIPEVIRILAQKYKICIVSNCECGYIETFLEMNHLNEFVVDHLCIGDTGKLKAENIKLIIERNNLKSPWYVGDTEGDLKACQKAGVPFIYATYGFGKLEEYSIKIDKPWDLIEMTGVL